MRTVIVCLLALAITATASFAEKTESYGWEDNSSTSLGFYGNVGVQDVVTDIVHTGTYAFHTSETPLGGTPQVYGAWVGNLVEGDEVTASVWAYDLTPETNPAARIWGHYCLNSDITAYEGSAGGPEDYSAGTGWSQLTHTWTIPADKESLVIELRMYSVNDNEEFWWDDISVTVPDGAQIIFPDDTPIVDTDETTWGGVKALYK